MRSLRCLCFICVVCSGFCTAASQQKTESGGLAESTSELTASADAPASMSIGGGMAPVATLAEDIDPNPPSPDDLARDHRSWKGEYEADKQARLLLDENDKAIPILYDKKGHRVHMTAKVPRAHPVKIVAGVLTVDGWIGKAELNYDIRDLRYLYISAPPVGTMIVANSAFPGATEIADAFTASGLALKLGEHEVLLETKKPILHEKGATSAWVKVDKTFLADRRSPVLGYGIKLASPYQWPGAKLMKASDKGYVPQLPENMRPKIAQRGCNASKPCGF